MKTLFAFFCFMAVAATGVCQKDSAGVKKNTANRPASPNAPVVKVTAVPEESLSFSEDVFDFGKIAQGKPVTHTFVFKNTGTKPLALENVNASCGCTTPIWNSDPIAPGKTGSITVGYNAAAEGVFDKSVTVIYNGNLVRQIHVKGEVWKSPTTSAPENNVVKSIREEQ